MNNKLRKKHRLSYTGRKALYGYCFIAVWILGFITFFLRPLITTVIYSMNDIKFNASGTELTFNNFSAYRMTLLEDPELLRKVLGCFTNLFYTVPVIVILSILIAVMLNSNFLGKTFFRAVFFLPVIISGGAVLSVIRGNDVMTLVVEGTKSSGSMLQVSDVQSVISNFNLPEELSSFLISVSNTVFDMLWKSGIQILLFLGALQTISPSIYEASMIEGASNWDNFWKITMPMISPMIVVAVIYSVIDSFTDSQNAVMSQIISDATYLKYTNASVLSVIYFILTLAFIGIVYFALNKLLPYSGTGGKS